MIAELRARNIAVDGSWDDMLPDPEKVAATSASMTLSHHQTTDFTRLFPAVPAYHVTHHVNTQVGPVRRRTGCAAISACCATRRPRASAA